MSRRSGRCVLLLIVAVMLLAAASERASQPLAAESMPPAAHASQASAPPTAGGLITGRVIDADTESPLSGAVVTLSAVQEIIDAQGNSRAFHVSAASASRLGTISPMRVLTGTDGAFLFRDLPLGEFDLSVQHSAYLPASYGQRRSNGPARNVVLTTGQPRADLTVRVWKPGALSGSVLDEAGNPMVGVDVRVLRRVPLGGRFRYEAAGSIRTDGQGQYRFDTLTPGEYAVAVPSGVVTIPDSLAEAYRLGAHDLAARLTRELSPPAGPVPIFDPADLAGKVLDWRGPVGRQSTTADGRKGALLVYPTMFYPAATTVADTLPLRLEPGREVAAIGLELHLVPSVSVSGTLRAPGGPEAHAGLRLVPVGVEPLMSDREFEAAITASDAHGAFRFLGVPPGLYALTSLVTIDTFTLDLSRPRILTPPAHRLLWASVPIEVSDRDVSDVVVDLQEDLLLSGRVEFEGSAARPTPTELRRMSIVLVPVDTEPTGALAMAPPDAAGQFTTGPHVPGRYQVVIGDPNPPWRLKTVTVGGRDVSDLSVDLTSGDVSDVVVTMTDQETILSGTVQVVSPAQPRDVTVVLLPGDVESWIQSGMVTSGIRSVATSSTGGFVIRNVRPGDHLVLALTADVGAADLQDPDFVRAAAQSATRIRLALGEHRVQALTVRPPR